MSNERARTVEVREHVGERVTICGWVHAIRRMGTLAFVVVRDGWGTMQVVASRTALAPLEEARAGPESVVRVRGRAVHSEAASGGVEIVEPEIEVMVAVTEPLPVELSKQIRKAKLPTLLDHAPTVLRAPARRAMVRIAASVMAGFRRTLEGLGFCEIQTPKLVGAATESGANVFGLDYFGGRAYLAQSPQLYKQIMVGVLERVFEVGPVFRAEPHATVRHLSQYVSLDVELGFIEDHGTVIEVLEAVLTGIIETLRSGASEALALLSTELATQLPSVPSPLPRIDFEQARRMLAAEGIGPVEADDLAPAEERWLGAWAEREHGSAWLVVTGYPMSKRPFYTHPAPGRPAVSNSFDLLFRGTELVTGGQRLHEHAALHAAMEAAGIDPEPLRGYLEAFRFGMPPHGGFAIGLERFVTQLLGLDNIRLATLLPRDPGRLTP